MLSVIGLGFKEGGRERRESQQGENRERQRRRKKWETEEERVRRRKRKRTILINKDRVYSNCIALPFRLRGNYRRIPLNLKKIGQGDLNHWLSHV